MSPITLENPKLVGDQKSIPPGKTREILWLCPTCREGGGLLPTDDASHAVGCPSCGFAITNHLGIWHALPASREIKFHQFIKEYQTVRINEGRGKGGAHYFLSLPYKDASGQNSWQWKIRGRSFRYFTRKILGRYAEIYPLGMDVLDVGAGNCWMSYRLAQRGHRPLAVDIFENEQDGLGAGRHYLPYVRGKFPRFLAEMDRLPFADAQFDMVVFNASYHYSEDYEITLLEALRCLRRPGHVLIMDSPFYRTEAGGIAMVQEKRARFEQRFGFKADSIASREFLTDELLKNLGRKLGIRWECHKPWYGLGWGLRPWRARLSGCREPARFQIALGTAERS